MKLIERPQYLNFLLRNKDLPLIKVITGVRGSGKSTLFTLYKDYLTTHGVPVERIISINFEDLTSPSKTFRSTTRSTAISQSASHPREKTTSS